MLKTQNMGIKIPLNLCGNIMCEICSVPEWRENYNQNMMKTLSLVLQDEKFPQLAFNS